MGSRALFAALGATLVVVLCVAGAGSAKPPRPRPHKPRPHKTATAPTVSAIAAENALPGTAGWLGPEATGRAAEVYASATDVVPGGSVPIHVSVGGNARYRVIVYRLGWYGGLGARQVACLPSCDGSEQGTQQPFPAQETNGAIVAGWPVTDTVMFDQTWLSGYFMIRVLLLSGDQQGKSATTYVIVDSPRPDAKILIQVPVNTWQAYNSWGGRSLYDFPGLGRRATRVSFDRPYLWTGPGGQGPLGWELPFVRFVERNGYDVTYQSDVYTDEHPDSLRGHKLVAVAGHSEYWTTGMRDAFDAARDDARVNLAFLGANDAYWQVRIEDGGRTVMSYKSTSDPEPNPRLKTAMFREVGRRECELEGVQHQGASPLYWKPGDYTVPVAAIDDPWFKSTGFLAGSIVPGVVSVESDAIPGTETAGSSCGHSLTVLFHRELGGDKDGNADAVRYTNYNGAIVFASGSHQFAWGLDEFAGGQGIADPRLEQFMRNALDAMTT